MDNVHERANSFREEFSEFSANGYLENFFSVCEISKYFRHLRKNLRELLFYKLLNDNSFNLFCLLVSLACVLMSQSLKICYYRSGEVIETITSLARKHCFYIPN